MNKSEMTGKLAAKCDLTQAKAAEVVNCIFDTKSGSGIIAVELDAGRKVSLPGFGTFGTKFRKRVLTIRRAGTDSRPTCCYSTT